MVTKREKQRAAVFRALADPTRREILSILRGGRQSVGGIARNFRMSRPAISKHVRLLQAAGLVRSEARGTSNLCSLDAQPLGLVREWILEYEAFWRGSLASLKGYMEEKS